MRERFLWIGISLIVLSTAGNYLFFQSKQLDEPIFLKHYYSQELESQDQEGNIEWTFHYLTNKQNPKTVQSTEVDGITGYPAQDQGITFWEEGEPQINFEQEYNHHYLVPVTIEIPAEQIPMDNDSWSFESMHVTFSDQTDMNTKIGKIGLIDEAVSEDVFESSSASSSNDGEVITTLNVSKPIDVEEISVPFSDEIGDEMAINIGEVNGKKHDISEEGVFPISFQEGESLRIQSQFSPNSSIYVDVEMGIKGETEDGDLFTRGFYVNDQPYFTQKEILDIIAEKAGDTE